MWHHLLRLDVALFRIHVRVHVRQRDTEPLRFDVSEHANGPEQLRRVRERVLYGDDVRRRPMYLHSVCAGPNQY